MCAYITAATWRHTSLAVEAPKRLPWIARQSQEERIPTVARLYGDSAMAAAGKRNEGLRLIRS